MSNTNNNNLPTDAEIKKKYNDQGMVTRHPTSNESKQSGAEWMRPIAQPIIDQQQKDIEMLKQAVQSFKGPFKWITENKGYTGKEEIRGDAAILLLQYQSYFDTIKAEALKTQE